jgi:hypothetical protein
MLTSVKRHRAQRADAEAWQLGYELSTRRYQQAYGSGASWPSPALRASSSTSPRIHTPGRFISTTTSARSATASESTSTVCGVGTDHKVVRIGDEDRVFVGAPGAAVADMANHSISGGTSASRETLRR